MNPDSQTIEPFSVYGLDSDEVPQRSGDDSFAGRWEVPSDAWDALLLNKMDQQDLSLENFAAVRGHLSFNIPPLPNRLTTMSDATSLHIHVRSKVSELIKSHPEKFLHLLHSVLPDDVRYWPYGTGDAFEAIGKADDSLLSDSRLREMRRRWNAR